MSDEIRIVKATEADLSYFVACGVAVKELEESMGFDGYADTSKFIREYSKYVILIQDDARYVLLIAKDGNKNVGSMIGSINLMERFYNPDSFCTIVMVYVEKEYRDKHIGHRMTRMFQDMMQDMGVTKIVSYIYSANGVPQQKLIEHGHVPGFIQYWMTIKKKGE